MVAVLCGFPLRNLKEGCDAVVGEEFLFLNTIGASVVADLGSIEFAPLFRVVVGVIVVVVSQLLIKITKLRNKSSEIY